MKMIKKHTTWFAVLFLCLSWQVHGQTVDLKKGLVAYYPFNGNVKDESGNGNHGKNIGGKFVEGLGGGDDQALSLEGDSHVTVDKKFAFMRNSSISFWFRGNEKKQPRERVAVIQTANMMVLFQNMADNHVHHGYKIYVFFHDDRNGNSSKPWSSERFFIPNFKKDEWNHIAVRINNSDECFLNMNGEAVPLQSSNRDLPSGVYRDTLIGASDGGKGPNTGVRGVLDNIRIYDRKISDKEVAAIHELDKAPKAPSITEGLVAFYPFNGNANDESGNGNHGTVSGAKLTEDRFGKTGKAYLFDGGDEIKITGNSLSTLPEEYAISTWIKKTGNSPDVLATIIGSNDRSTGWWLYYRRGDGPKSLGFSSEGVGETAYNKELTNGQWHHVVVTRIDSARRIYLDGSLMGVREYDKNRKPSQSGNPVYFGTQKSSHGGRSWVGAIDDTRIYNRALSESEVKMLHDSEKESPVIEKPIISAISQNAVADEGETIEFIVTAEGDKPLKYEWKKLGSNTVLSNMGSLVLKKVDEEDAGSYYVIVSNEGGEAISPVITLGIRPDTDNDGLLDYVEEKLGTSITKRDTDDDGISDYDEVEIFSTAPTRADTDGDGLDDGLEIRGKFNPRKPTERADGSIAIGVAVELEFFTLTWNRYQLQWSKDLERWKDLGDPFQGVGGYSSILQPARKAKVYWRLRIID